jgi:hypothetical protein
MIIQDLSTASVLGAIKRQLNEIESKRTHERYTMMNYYEGLCSEMEADIRKYFDSESLRQTPIMVESLTQKLVNARAIVYKTTPERVVDERYNDYLDDLDSAMLRFERMCYLLGTVAMKSRWNEDTQKIDYVPLVEFYPIFEQHKENPAGCFYPLYNHSSKLERRDQVFAYWSDTDHYLVNGKGQIIDNPDNPDGINPYGIKPIVYAHRQVLTSDWFREGASDIVAMNRSINIMLTEMSLSMRLQMLGQPVLTSIDEASKIKLGVDKPLVLPENSDFRFESPGGNLIQYIEAMRFLVDSVAYNHNLRTKWSVGKESMMSGEALKMSEIDLTESVMLDAQMVWRPVENDRYEIDRAIIEYESGVKLEEEYSIDYSEPRFPESASEERAQWDWEWANQLSSKKDWYRKYNPDATEDQIAEIIETAETEGSPTTPDAQPSFTLKNDLL